MKSIQSTQSKFQETNFNSIDIIENNSIAAAAPFKRRNQSIANFRNLNKVVKSLNNDDDMNKLVKIVDKSSINNSTKNSNNHNHNNNIPMRNFKPYV